MRVRSKFSLVVGALFFAALALPSVASAQDEDDSYSPDDPGGSVTGVTPEEEETITNTVGQSGPVGSISVPSETNVELTIPESVAGVITNVKIEFNPVVYDGPVPGSRQVSFQVDDCGAVVTVTYTFANGSTRVDTFNVAGVGACDTGSGGTASTTPSTPELAINHR